MNIFKELKATAKADRALRDRTNQLKHPLRLAREAAGVTMVELIAHLRAHGIRANLKCVHSWERGRRPVTRTAEVIADLYGVSIDLVQTGKILSEPAQLVETQLAMMPRIGARHGHVLRWLVFDMHWMTSRRARPPSRPSYPFFQRGLPTTRQLRYASPHIVAMRQDILNAVYT